MGIGVEGAGELGVGEVAELVGEDGAEAGEEEELAALGEVADLIGGEEGAGGVVLGEGEALVAGIEGVAHGLEDDGLLAEEIGDQAGGVVIVDAEDL